MSKEFTLYTTGLASGTNGTKWVSNKFTDALAKLTSSYTVNIRHLDPGFTPTISTPITSYDTSVSGISSSTASTAQFTGHSSSSAKYYVFTSKIFFNSMDDAKVLKFFTDSITYALS